MRHRGYPKADRRGRALLSPAWNQRRRNGFLLSHRLDAVTVSIAIPESRRCRDRALECRSVASRLRLQNARNQMLRVAANYERMARDAEQREIAQGVSLLGALVVRQRHGQRAA
jgi:hypothetical protein